MTRAGSRSAPVGALCALVVCLLGVSPARAAAPTGDAARFADLYERSAEAYQNGRFDQAVSLLRQAYALRPEPTLLFNIGLAQEEAGDLRGALDTYRRYLVEAKDPAGRDEARKRIAAVTKKTGEGLLTIRVDAPDATVHVDGGEARAAPVTELILPAGPHQIAASAPGRIDVSETFTVVAGEVGMASLELPDAEAVTILPEPVEPLPVVSSSPYAVWGGVVTATGGALAVSGAVLLVMANDNQSTFESARSSGDPVRSMTRSAAVELDSTVRLESRVGIGLVAAGGAALATGITLLLLPADNDPAGGSAYVAPDPNGGLLVGGTF